MHPSHMSNTPLRELDRTRSQWAALCAHATARTLALLHLHPELEDVSDNKCGF